MRLRNLFLLPLVFLLAACADSDEPNGPVSAADSVDTSTAPADAARSIAAEENASTDTSSNEGLDYVQLTQDAQIYQRAESGAETITEAPGGTTFELSSNQGEWYGIYMFSGAERYVKKDEAQLTADVRELPEAKSVRRSACLDAVAAQDRAMSESKEEYPSDVMKQIEYQRVLQDRYETEVYANYGLPPARSSTLNLQCAKNNWMP